MNFSAISRDQWYGKALRAPLHLLPKRLIVPILQGPARGSLWVVGSSNHGCWLGSYEYRKARAFAARIPSGSVVWDVGAHVGYYTLIAARRVGPSGRIVAVEPFPPNLLLLRRHLGLNRRSNVSIIEGALSDHDGEGYLREGPSSSECCLSDSGIRVHCFTLDTLVFRNGLPAPEVLKIDVEGAEGDVLRGGLEVLSRYRPCIWLAVHSRALLEECRALLEHLGYHVRNFETFELVAEHCTKRNRR